MTAITPAIVVPQETLPQNITPLRISLFNEDRTPYKAGGEAQESSTLTSEPTPAPAADEVLMTGYVAENDDDILETDTVVEAIAKLAARLAEVAKPTKSSKGTSKSTSH
jgi:hypothetical protein